MVFKTDDMDALEETLPRDKNGRAMSTHYIKRMIGMPNEVLNIVSPTVEIDGVPLTAPETIMRIANVKPPYPAGYEGGERQAGGGRVLCHGRQHA